MTLKAILLLQETTHLIKQMTFKAGHPLKALEAHAHLFINTYSN